MYTCKKLLKWLICGTAFIMPGAAFAGGLTDFSLAPFVPWVLDAMMMVASTVYDFFVGDKGSLVYVIIWIFLGATITITLVKMYFPKDWLSFIGFSGGGEIFEGNITGTQIFEKVARPMLRAIIAMFLLLQITPQMITNYLANPFLTVGSIYTETVMTAINEPGMLAPDAPSCPAQVIENGWISQNACEFLVKPVSDISYANNKIVKRGFQFISNGLLGLMTLIPNGGEDFLNLVTGIILVFTFIASNLFMALLIIQGIFNFGMQVILYPVNVLTYVIKPSDKWFDIWPAFDGLVKALQQLIVTIIACAFILGINIAVVKALFQWNSSVFVAAAQGTSVSNMPATGANTGFGDHSIMWLSALLTFFLMFKIFEMTRTQLDMYVGKGMDKLYNQTINDTKAVWNGAKQLKGQYLATKDNIGVLADATGVVGKKIGSGAKSVWKFRRRLFGRRRP